VKTQCDICTVEYDPNKEVCKNCKGNPLNKLNLSDNDMFGFLKSMVIDKKDKGNK